MSYDDETLMAYADGELEEARRAEIAAAVAKDPELARRVERHRATRARVSGAFARVLDQPLPEKLIAAARGADANAGATQRRADVLQFPARASAPPSRGWGTREWAAMAASVILGVLISWQWLSPEPLMSPRNGALVARGALATALDTQLASTQREDNPVQVGISFRSGVGEYCRSFAVRESNTAGLACRAGDEWRIAVTAAHPDTGGPLRQAASPPPAVVRGIEDLIVGEPLDAEGEKQALAGGWKVR